MALALHGNDQPIGIDVTIPKRSNLVVLSSSITKEQAKEATKLHKEVIALAMSDHAKLLNLQKSNLENQLNRARIELEQLQDPVTLDALIKQKESELEKAKADLAGLTNPEIFGVQIKKHENAIQAAKNRLTSLKDHEALLQTKLERISTQQKLTTEEIHSLQKRIEEALQLQALSANGVKDTTSAVTQLFIDNQVEQDRKWLAQLKEQLHITLENQKSEIEKQLNDNRRKQQLARAHVDQAKQELDKLIKSNQLQQATLRSDIEAIKANIQKIISNHEREVELKAQEIKDLEKTLNSYINTKVVTEPVLQPPSSSKKKLLLISIIAFGLIAGFLMVFIQENIAKSRPTSRQDHTNL